MKIFLRTVMVFGLVFTAMQGKAQNLALILSFENYENGPDVRNALRSHNDLLTAYQDAGFQTFAGRDRSNAQLRRLLTEFADALADADNAVIHINGHVVSFGQQSWVLPVDAQNDSLAGLEIDGISVNFLLALLAQKPEQSVLFLGMADRDFANIAGMRRGVSNANIPDNVMMVSGPVRDVARAVAQDFLDPDTIVLQALSANRRQLDFDGDIPIDLILAEGGLPPPPRVDTSAEIESALGLSRNQRRSIQADLTLLGHELGSIDGVFGNATRHAIGKWQKDERFPETGYLNAEQVRRLDILADTARFEVETRDRAFWARSGAAGTVAGLQAYIERFPDGLFAGRARDQLLELLRDDDQNEWLRAVDTNTLQAYQRYLRRFPEGTYNRLAKVRIQEFAVDEPDPHDNARRAEERLRLDNSSRLLIELRLAGLGYRVGTPDGNFNNATRNAIRQYQDDGRLPVTGYVSSDMIRMLLLGR